MGRSFTEDEKAEIRQHIMDAGRECFVRFGLKKTNIEDLTRPAGVAKSTFYLFFDSKERLYWELIIADGQQYADAMIDALNSASDAREGIVRFLRMTLNIIETYPLFRRLLEQPEEQRLIAERIALEQSEAKIGSSVALMLPFIQRWQAQGHIIAHPPQIIAAALRVVTLLPLMKDSIGHEFYADVLALYIDLIADGLTQPAALRSANRSQEKN